MSADTVVAICAQLVCVICLTSRHFCARLTLLQHSSADERGLEASENQAVDRHAQSKE